MPPPPPPPTPPPLPQPAVPQDFNAYCQGCRCIAPTKQVRFYQHIGAILLMFNRHIKGRMCRTCVNEHFAKTTLITTFCGWWGMISCIVTPFFLLHNLIRYLLCLGLKPAADGRPTGAPLAWFAFAAAICVLSLPILLIAFALSHPPPPH